MSRGGVGTLEYESGRSRGRRWWRWGLRAVGVAAAGVVVWAAVRYGPAVQRRAMVRYWAGRCLEFEMPEEVVARSVDPAVVTGPLSRDPDYVVETQSFDSGAARAPVLLYRPRALREHDRWESRAASAISALPGKLTADDPSTRWGGEAGVAFLGRLRSVSGKDWVVVVYRLQVNRYWQAPELEMSAEAFGVPPLFGDGPHGALGPYAYSGGWAPARMVFVKRMAGTATKLVAQTAWEAEEIIPGGDRIARTHTQLWECTIDDAGRTHWTPVGPPTTQEAGG